jgi:putative membrane protein
MLAMVAAVSCVPGLMLSSAGQSDASTPAQMQSGGDQGKSSSNAGPASDRKFVEKAIESSLGDVEMGRLALEKSTDSQVRHFAIEETEDHGRILDDLKQVAAQLQMSVPDGQSKSGLKDIDKLKALSGGAFDEAYLKETVKRHKDEDKSYRDEARTTTSPQLKELITQEIQILGTHLQQAQELAQAKDRK